MNQFRCLLLMVLVLLAGSNPVLAAAEPHIGLNDVIATVEKSFRTTSEVANPTRQNQVLAPPIATFSANFFQRTLLATGRELRADGQVTVQMPDGRHPLRYRFEYFRPSQQEIVSNGRSLWIYHPENREVILADVSILYPNYQQDSAVNFLQGLNRISKDFLVNFASGMNDSAGNYVLELQPRRSMLDIQRLLVVVNRVSVAAYKNGTVALNTPASVPSPRNQGMIPQPRSPFGTQPSFGSLASDQFPLLSTTVYDHNGNSTTVEFTNVEVNSRLMESFFDFMIPGGVQVVRPNERTLPR